MFPCLEERPSFVSNVVVCSVYSQIRKLKMQLEEERQKPSKMDAVFMDGEKMENGTDLHFIEMQSKLCYFSRSVTSTK